jgi:hypothetical protein
MPVRNGAATLRAALAALLREGEGRPFEILVVDDGSVDGSPGVVRSMRSERITLLEGGEGRGAAAAINAGLAVARHPVVAQVDQDVVVEPGWLARLLDALDATGAAAAQGWYIAPPDASLPARVMALDLACRYRRIAGGFSDHVCTGNVVWRRQAVLDAGALDERLGYGYDNDLSYRLSAAGHRMVIVRDARAVHHWREGWAGYLRQQYGFGYGRLDLVARHRNRLLGDRVSPAGMMAHPPVMAVSLALLAGSAVTGAAGLPARGLVAAGALGIGALALERTIAGVRAALRERDAAGLCFPLVHLARDVAWVAALAVWSARRLTGRETRPHHSMRPRDVRTRTGV